MNKNIKETIKNILTYVSVILANTIVLLTLIVSTAEANDLEIRGYSEKKLGYDKWYYTAMGVDVRMKTQQAIFQIKKGVMFASKGASIGNHQYYYNEMNVKFLLTKYIWVGAELLTEINPFEGNDLNLTKQQSVQGFSLGLHNLSVTRSKFTNSNFYMDYQYYMTLEKWFTETKVLIKYTTFGKRGKASLLKFWQDESYSIELGLIHWWKIPINRDLDLAIKGSYFMKQYLQENILLPGYSISVGLISM